MSFYSSNEKKLKKFVQDRRIKEENEEIQQDIVDEQIAKELGLESKATRIGELSKRVARKLGTVDTNVVNSSDILGTAINNGKLTELFDKLKMLSDASLNPIQKIIKKDLSSSEFKNTMNTLISEAMPNGIDAIKEAVISTLGGTENQKDVLDMFNKIQRPELLKNIPKREKTKDIFDDVLIKAIDTGKFSELIDEIRNFPKEKLNKTQKTLQKRLNTPSIIDAINRQSINAIEQNNKQKIPKYLTDEIINNEKEEKEWINMVKQTNKFKELQSPKSNTSGETETTSMFGVSNIGRPPKYNKENIKQKIVEIEEEIKGLEDRVKNMPKGKKNKPNEERKNLLSAIRNKRNLIKNKKAEFNLN